MPTKAQFAFSVLVKNGQTELEEYKDVSGVVAILSDERLSMVLTPSS
jgi:hypothetical protein